MDFSAMTDDQVFDALRAAEKAEYEAKAIFMACSLELENRANAEYERQQTGENCDMSVEEAYARDNAFTRVLAPEEIQFLASLTSSDFPSEE